MDEIGSILMEDCAINGQATDANLVRHGWKGEVEYSSLVNAMMCVVLV